MRKKPNAEGSQVVMVSSKEEHERQAMNLTSFISQMTHEFMNFYHGTAKQLPKHVTFQNKTETNNPPRLIQHNKNSYQTNSSDEIQQDSSAEEERQIKPRKKKTT